MAGVRYVVMCINSFTEQPYCDLPECLLGGMDRQTPNSGKNFEAKTVVDEVDVAPDAKVSLPAVFDLVNRALSARRLGRKLGHHSRLSRAGSHGPKS